jgi:farnesyl-diphosphate farnesyltransferase
MMQTIEVVEPTTAQQSYLNARLQEVSRSFALVVPCLDPPLRHYLATAYLVCRVVDNIEDAGQAAPWKRARFAEFARLLRQPDQAGEILAAWQREQWPALTPAEQAMMGPAQGGPLWQIYAELPPPTQDSIRRWAGIMADGMLQASEAARPPELAGRPDLHVLESEADYNRYCYFVAGTVGHMVTELVIERYDFPPTLAGYLRDRAEACGRALQKTNIVKDFAEDLRRGDCFLPATWLRQAEWTPLQLQGAEAAWKLMVLEDVLGELHTATDYIVALPYSAPDYRRAALLCLLPAYQTMLCAAQSQAYLFTPAHHAKISRTTMAQCLADAQAMVGDNKALASYRRRLEDKIHDQFGRPTGV